MFIKRYTKHNRIKKSKYFLFVMNTLINDQIEQKTETVEYFGGSDACQGDSGGPLWVWQRQGHGKQPRAVQIGVVSRGEGCAYRNRPGIFTKLERFANFIKAKVKSGGCTQQASHTRFY